MTEFAGRAHRLPEKVVVEDGLGRKVLVVEKLDDYPRADNQGLEPGLYDPDSSQNLLVRPTEPEENAKGRERLDPNNRNWPCG